MFSILIPTWNNLAYLKSCVASIRRHSAQAHEIVLYINEGADGTLEWVRAEGLPFIHSPRNVGICVAMNEAAGLATHEHLVYLNDDMVVLPGWDSALAEAIPARPGDCFLLSGTMIEPRATGNPCAIVADYGGHPDDLRMSALLAEFASLPHADWQGASWPPTLVHRRWWRIVGGYSVELSPGMASDTDFAMKLWAAGCRTFRGVAASRIYHFQGRSTGRARKNDGGAQFLAKWGITQSAFSRLYLRRGEPYDGALPEPDAAALRWERLRGALKRRLGAAGVPVVLDQDRG